MRATCPSCGAEGHVSAFFAEADGKRFAVLFAAMAPELGRAVIDYLGLFKPSKTALRLPRATKLVEELRDLVAAGDVTNDERGGVRRAASPAIWVAGIEQMLAQRASLVLPLKSHLYLRAVVFGLADQADAAAERQKEASVRAGQHRSGASGKPVTESPLVAQLKWIERMVEVDAFSPSQAAEERDRAHREFGGGHA